VTAPRILRILLGGIGNVFLGDDAFGVEVAQRLARRGVPEGVRVIDFGVRGFDLACALNDGYDEAILIDAAPRGGAPGTLYVIEPSEAPPPVTHGAPGVEGHGLDPVKVLALARAMGGPLPRVRVLACEPLRCSEDDVDAGLSDPVRAAIEPAVEWALALVDDARRGSRA
jgi:hydrogenase maturation protease